MEEKTTAPVAAKKPIRKAPRRKVCTFCVEKVTAIDYKDTAKLKKYITEKRMNEIRICIQNGKKPQELSEEFGFSNYSTLYRSYCKHFGIPPSHTKSKTKAR